MDDNKKIKVLEMIADDMKNDAVKFDGQPFNGKTVATYFGNQGAAIAALANIIRSDLKRIKYDCWVKRLGQWHLSKPGAHKTLCDKPMLGSNYILMIPESERKKCEKCWEVINESNRD